MPDGVMPLRLFEPRYIDMVKNCFKTDTGFGVCLIKQGPESGGIAEPYPLGTQVSIIDFDQGADGLLHITVRGVREFSVLTYAANDANLLVAQIELLAEQSPLVMTPDFENLASKLELILHYIEPEIDLTEMHFDDPNWVCHRLLEVLPLAAPAKFELLQLVNNSRRLESLSGLQIEIASQD